MSRGRFSGALVCAALLLSGCMSTAETTQNPVLGQDVLSHFSAEGVERSIVHVTGDIYRFRNNNHTSLFVPTEQGVVLIDPLNPGTADWVGSEIERLFGQKVTHVLYSHGHQDHASGAAVFEGAEVISHANTLNVIRPDADEALPGRYAALDKNRDGVLDASELTQDFDLTDSNSDGLVSGAEAYNYFYKDVMPPTQTYQNGVHLVEVGGKAIEMHYVGGNHAPDMSYIFFPEERLVFYVDVISLRAIPFGDLPWYSKSDSQNTYDKALAIGAEIVVPSHGPIGTQQDVRDLRQYMADLRGAVSEKIAAGMALEQIQQTLIMEDYADWDSYDRLPQNIAGMHRALLHEQK